MLSTGAQQIPCCLPKSYPDVVRFYEDEIVRARQVRKRASVSGVMQ